MTETDLYEQIARYMNLKHPGVLYHFDLSGVWTPSHKTRNLYGRLNRRAFPDLFIAYPTNHVLYFNSPVIHENTGEPLMADHGLFIELKREGTRIYRRDGELVANEHIREQAAVLEELRKQGYAAEFAVGFDQAVSIIEQYLGGEL